MNTDPFIQSWEEPDAADPSTNPPANRDPATPFPATIAHDVALAQDQEELGYILTRHGITPTEFDYIADLPGFKREVADWRAKILNEGYGFKLKLRAVSEAYIPEVVKLLYSPSVAPSVRTDLFKYITKCAELEPKKESSSPGDPGNPGQRITINIAAYAAAPTKQTQTIDITPAAPDFSIP